MQTPDSWLCFTGIFSRGSGLGQALQMSLLESFTDCCSELCFTGRIWFLEHNQQCEILFARCQPHYCDTDIECQTWNFQAWEVLGKGRGPGTPPPQKKKRNEHLVNFASVTSMPNLWPGGSCNRPSTHLARGNENISPLASASQEQRSGPIDIT